MSSYKRELWTETDIVCPFYLSKESGSNNVTITCEGYKDGMSVVSRFQRLSDREKHIGTYCAYIYRYNRCPIYKMIYNEKYSDEVLHRENRKT